MTTQLSTKFTALAVALTINGLLFGGVAVLFSGQIRAQPVASLLSQTQPTPTVAQS